MSLRYSNLLNNYVDWTDDEILSGKKYLKWEELTIKWEDIHLTWDEIFILLEVENIIKGGSGNGQKEYIDGNPWKQLRKDIGDEKTKKVIKIFCRVNGIEYEESSSINEKIKITASEFEIFIMDSIKKEISVKVETKF